MEEKEVEREAEFGGGGHAAEKGGVQSRKDTRGEWRSAYLVYGISQYHISIYCAIEQIKSSAILCSTCRLGKKTLIRFNALCCLFFSDQRSRDV